LACAVSALLGLLAAVTFLVVIPPSHHARAVLALAHDPEADPSRAMVTDVSLLRTRAVVSRTIAQLGLTTSAEDFLKSVTGESLGSELLSITLTAPTDAEAVRRLDALTSTYLEFRAEQLSTQANMLVEGIEERIRSLEG